MKQPGDPVTMACYGEGSGSQARWYFNNKKIFEGVRKKIKGEKETEKGQLPLADFTIFTPSPDLAVIISCWLLYELHLWVPADYSNVAVLWGKGRAEVNIHKAHNREPGFRLYTLFTFLLHFYFKHRKKNKKRCKEKRKKRLK